MSTEAPMTDRDKKKLNPTAFRPFGVEFVDGGYSVRQAVDYDHARELCAERYPDRAILMVSMLPTI